jgi:hypothetical protein
MSAMSREETDWRHKTRGRKGAGAETLSQQVINNSAVAQQEITMIRLFV